MVKTMLHFCVAAVPVNTDDAWGSPAPPADSSTSSDPFGDGSKKDDPWGSLSSTANDETGTFVFAPTAPAIHRQVSNMFPSSNTHPLPVFTSWSGSTGNAF